MDTVMRSAIVGEYGAALDMLRDAIDKCPDALWDDRAEGTPFWQTAYHTLYYVDLYLSESPESFTPPHFYVEQVHLLAGDYPWFDPPITVGPPTVTFRKDQLTDYLGHCWRKAADTVNAITPERAAARCGFFWYEMSAAELLLLNFRHAQHHVGQLAATLRRRANVGVDWRP